MIRRGIAIALLAGLAAVLAVPATAQSPQCQQISAQLQKIDRSGGTVDPLSDALVRQRDAIARGTADYQRRCQQIGIFGGVPPQCGGMQARLAEMQDNLARLEARTRRSGNAALGASPADRARLLAAWRQAGCDQPGGTVTAASGRPAQAAAGTVVANSASAGGRGGRVFTLQGPNGPVTYREDESGRVVRDDTYYPPQRVAVAPAQAPRGGGLMGALFGERPPGVTVDDPYARPGSAASVDGTPADGDGTPADGGGAYRTLCVRMCDGYYFPISYSTGRSRFGLDADVCRARCPGSETRLFAHPTGSDSETAVSADDTAVPYTKIPNALRYRTEYVSGCGCGRPDPTLLPVNASSEEGASSASSTVKVGDVREDLPVPRAKPEPDEDPDTRFNAVAGFVPVPIEPKRPGEEAVAAEGAAPATPRQVRTVGPKFFATR